MNGRKLATSNKQLSRELHSLREKGLQAIRLKSKLLPNYVRTSNEQEKHIPAELSYVSARDHHTINCTDAQ